MEVDRLAGLAVWIPTGSPYSMNGSAWTGLCPFLEALGADLGALMAWGLKSDLIV